jgi:triphosphoribosyl-dephospho-CoA synthase
MPVHGVMLELSPRATGVRYRPVETATDADFADLAVWALIEEARLTPKPALVDLRGCGAHRDLDLAAMLRSARALHTCFRAIAEEARGQIPTQALRVRLAAIGRAGEEVMFAATGGANTHRGAIWSLGLLVAASASLRTDELSAVKLAGWAAALARHPDSAAPHLVTHGALACARYGVPGARGEAAAGFPHVVELALPALRTRRRHGQSERTARLDALLTIMTSLGDTCLLHRGGHVALAAARSGARAVLCAGGTSTQRGYAELLRLDRRLLALNASPGGSADLLAAALFLDDICSRSQASLLRGGSS